MKNNDYILQTIMQPKGLKSMQQGGGLKDWWDDRYSRRRNRKQNKNQKKTQKKMKKQCDFNNKNPMCKRRR
jgi:hypothetical protein